MAKLIRLTFLLSIATLLQCSYCIREKRGLTELTIPNVNVANTAVETILDMIYGQERHKDEATQGRQLQGMDSAKAILDISDKIYGRVQNTPELTLLFEDLKKMSKHLNNIDSTFKQYESYRNSNASINDIGFHRFAKDSANDYTGLGNEIAEIFSLVAPSSTKSVSIKGIDYSIVGLMSKHVKDFKIVCNQYKSEQLLFRTILEIVTAALLKVLLIVEYSNRKLAENKEVDYENEMDLLKDTYQDRFKTLATVFQSYMSKSPLEVWRCDPESFVEGESYFKMNVFQKYIVRASDLEKEYFRCPKSCSKYQKATQHRCNPYSWVDSGLQYKEYYNSYGRVCNLSRSCAGILYDCSKKFTREQQVWACLADKNSSRRYEFIEEGYEMYLYGQKTSCVQGYSFDMTTVTGSIRHQISCNDVCLCTCDDSPSPRSDQKVNLRPATADKDHVITGIKWLKKNHTLHLQIQQGKIGKRGDVDASTVHWKDIQEPRNKNDTAIMNFHDLRGFHFQDVEVAKEHVLAGVKLEVVSHKIKYSRIFTLRLLPLAYEYDTGTLDYKKPFYEDPDGSVAEGVWDEPIAPEQVSHDNELYFHVDKLPTDTKEPSIPVDKSMKMTRLTTSDFDSDAGQTTIPFFDMQENAIVPPAPLSGVGIYFKKSKNYAGYLALKLLTFDSSSHIVKKIHIS